MQKANDVGHNTESSTHWLHIGVGNGVDAVFFVEFADGDIKSRQYCGLYVASQAWVTLPSSHWSNTTVLVYVTENVPGQAAGFTFGTQKDTAATFFAASNATLRMGSGFWTLDNQNVRQDIVTPDGSTKTSMVFSGNVRGSYNITSPLLGVGTTITYTKV